MLSDCSLGGCHLVLLLLRQLLSHMTSGTWLTSWSWSRPKYDLRLSIAEVVRTSAHRASTLTLCTRRIGKDMLVVGHLVLSSWVFITCRC